LTDLDNRSSDVEVPHLSGGRPASAGQLILERRRRLVEPFCPESRGHLVDFGCGNGAQTLLLAPRFDQVTGLDVSPAFLSEFQTEIRTRGWNDRVTTAEIVPGAGAPAVEPADVVTSFTVLEHVPDEAEALSMMGQLLRPGGRLLLSVPNKWWLFETHGANLPLLPWNRVPLVSWWPRFLHDKYARARIYTEGDIVRLVRRAGFTIDEVFRMTAPMDMIPWEPVRDLARATLFRPDRTSIPFLATEIVVAATR
jgi:2-polyprenyl-3-methyl-5-hydroxy-6-metoxy-1,4-benzoquinol methylase